MRSNSQRYYLKVQNLLNKNCITTTGTTDNNFAEFTAKYPSAEYWLEDKTENAECGLQFGLKSVLISHAHNEDCDNKEIIRCEDWNAIVHTVLG